MFDSAATIAIVGVLATTVGGLIWVLKYVFSELKPVLDQILVSTQANTHATEASTQAAVQAAEASQLAAKVSEEAVKVSRHADEYLRKRNGRDSEMHTELLAGMKEIPNAMNIIAKKSTETISQLIEAANNVSEQHVDKQIVDQREVRQ